MGSLVTLVVLSWCLGSSLAYYHPDFRAYVPEPNELSGLPACVREGHHRYRKQFKTLAEGLAVIFWDRLRHGSEFSNNGASNNSIAPSSTSATTDLTPLNHVTKACANDLLQLKNRAQQGHVDSLKFLDSSSTAPSGVLAGTLTNLGNYEGCLATAINLGSREIRAKYCTVNYWHLDALFEHANGIVHFDDVTIRELGATQSLCLPSSCSQQDVLALSRQVMACFPVHIGPDVECEVLDEVTLTGRASRLQWMQLLALAILGTIVAICILATLLGRSDGLLGNFNVRDRHNDAFIVRKDTEQRSLYLSIHKLIMILCGVVGHIIFCPETPRCFAMLSRVRPLLRWFTYPLIQLVLNESNFTHIAFLSGMAAYFLLRKSIIQKGMSYRKVFLNKWLRHMPSIAILACLELIFPLMSRGPLYIEVGQNIVKKISSYWWTNILFVGNLTHFFNGISQAPMIHTFFTYIEVQLLLLGIIAFKLLYSRPKLGIAYCVTVCLLGQLITSVMIYRYNVIPHMVTPKFSLFPLIGTFSYVHFAFYSYISHYLAGVLIAHVMHQLNFRFKSKLQLNIFTGLFMGTGYVAFSGPVWYNYYELYEPWASAVYYFFQKNGLVLCAIGSYVFDLHMREEGQRQKAMTRHETDKPKVKKLEKDSFSLIAGLNNLGFSIYMFNYWIIRVDYFSETEPYPAYIWPTIRRIFCLLIMILMLAYVFHVFLYAPLDRIRRQLFDVDVRGHRTPLVNATVSDGYYAKDDCSSLGSKASDHNSNVNS